MMSIALPSISASRVSIALCTYNGEKYLQAQLESISSQSQPPHELVICDDASNDHTREIAQEFARHAAFPVRIAHNAINLGINKNFEQAIRLCNGDIIALCDQDDVWRRDKLKVLISVFQQQPELDAVFSNATIVDERLIALGYTLWDAIRFTNQERKWAREGKIFDVLLRHNVVTGATFAFRANRRDLILPIPSSGIHDGWIALLIAVIGRIGLIDETLTSYRQHTTNVIGGKRRDLASRLRRPRGQASFDTLHSLWQLETAVNRLDESGLNTKYPEQFRHLGTKLRFLKVRADFTARTPGSIRSFLGEVVNGHYRRYAMGWLSVAHDLLKRTLNDGCPVDAI